MRSERGVILFTVLVVAALLAVMTITVTYHSTQSLRRSQSVQHRLQAEMAAAAGLQDALSRLRANDGYSSPIPATGLNGSAALYSVEVTRNDTAGPVTATDGTEIPAGAVYFLASGRTSPGYERRASALAVKPGATVTGFAVDGDVLLRDETLVDGWNSAAGPYGPATEQSLDLNTNTTSNGAVRLRDSARLKGNIRIGPSGVVASVVEVRDAASMTGTASAAAATISIPTHTAPFPPGSSDVNSSSGTQTLSPGAFGELRLQGTAEVFLNAGVYVFDRIQLEGSAKIRLNGPVTVYCAGDLDMVGDTSINEGGQPGDFKFYSTSSSDSEISLYGRSRVWTQAEGARLALSPYDDAEFFGTFLGESIDTWDRAKVHIATGTTAGGGGTWSLRGVRYF